MPLTKGPLTDLLNKKTIGRQRHKADFIGIGAGGEVEVVKVKAGVSILDSMCKYLNCRYIETLVTDDNYSVFVDEEGMISGAYCLSSIFSLDECPIFGGLVIAKCDDDGNNVRTTIREILKDFETPLNRIVYFDSEE